MTELNLRLGALAAGLKIAAKDDIRYYLNGILYQNGKLVATDGHAMVEMDAECDVPGEWILPRDTCEMMVRTAGKANLFKYVRLEITEQETENSSSSWFKVHAQAPMIDLNFVTVDGRYPDWKRVMPEHRQEHSTDASPVQVNPKYSMAMEEAAQLYVFNGKPSKMVQTRLWHREGRLVYVSAGTTGFHGVIMGIRE